MNEIFAQLSGMLMAGSVAAFSAALVWGILSVVLSPCHLASIPLVIGFVNNHKQPTVFKAFALSTVFSTGILVTIVAIGLITGFAGKMLGDIGPWGNYAVAVIFLLVGLNLWGIIELDFQKLQVTRNIPCQGILGAFLLGLVFGLALGPCTFAYMAPIIAVALTKSTPLYACALFGMYGAGHCAVIAAAGTSGGIVQKYLDWNENAKAIDIIKKICAVLVLVAGIYIGYLGFRM